jgi:hypothetical protein
MRYEPAVMLDAPALEGAIARGLAACERARAGRRADDERTALVALLELLFRHAPGSLEALERLGDRSLADLRADHERLG